MASVLAGQHGLVAARSFKPGETITKFHARALLPQPNMYTLQVSDKEHCDLGPEILQFMNHSCNPNMFVDTEAYNIEAVSDIQAGEDLTFFYPSTEWEMESPFQCMCGTACCLGSVQGAKFLPREVAARYCLNKHIQVKMS